MRKYGLLVLVALVVLPAVGCASQSCDLQLAPGESAVLLRFQNEGGRLVGIPLTGGDGGIELGPRLTVGAAGDSGGECHTDDQGHQTCECEWEQTDIGTFGLCMTFTANCVPGTLEPSADGYSCTGNGNDAG